jgi:type IV pilus assembly protein PilF
VTARQWRGQVLAAIAALLLQACVASSAPRMQPASTEEQAAANLNLGAAYMRQGRPDLAIGRLERALEQNPRLADGHAAMALALDQLGDLERAEQHYRRATQLEPANAPAANSYAVFLCRRGRWADAEVYFRRAANNPSYPTPAVALTNAGVCAREAGDLSTAESYFRSALERDAAFADALLNMSGLVYDQGNYLQARAFVQRYLAAHPAHPTILWLCFNVERRLEEPERAGECARQLRREFPESTEVARLQQVDDHAAQ